MARLELQIGGFGGQGVILAGLVIARALSLYDKKEAVFTQAYGPEARGGASSSGVVIDDERVDYPYPIHPDILVIMSQEAYTTYIDKLKEGGTLIIEKDLVKMDKVPEKVGDFHSIPATKIAEELGNRIVANIVMVGFITKVTGIVSKEGAKKSVLEMVPAKVIELNEKAFEMGYNYEEG
jgi:2-oxoglutarate ferredoxin oxidoreductase subunit gamma